MNIDVKAIRARCESATEAPWWEIEGLIHEMFCDNDADFISHARQDILALLDEVERLEKEVCPLRQSLEVARDTALFRTKYNDLVVKSNEKDERIAELEAELEWWHNLVHKHHKNYERSSLREIVQSFIDRIAELEMFVHNCYAEWGCDCQMEEEDGSCRACLAKKLLTQSKPQDKENKK